MGLRETLERKVRGVEALLNVAQSNSLVPYVAFSGGKDSTVMLDLVRRVFPDAPAVLSDDEWHLPETLEYIATIPNLVRVAGQRTHAEWFTAWENPADLPPGVQWIEKQEFDTRMGTWARANGCNAACIGIRAQENRRRRIHIGVSGPLFFAQSRQMWHCYPVAYFSLDEIWRYIRDHELPYNAAYDRMTAIGIAREHQRVGPLAVESVLGMGQLAILKRGWPDLFNRFAARYPQARNFA